MKSVIVHYQELALKGRNRPWFINTLVRNLRLVLSDLDLHSVRALMGRVEVKLGDSAPWETVRERLRRLPGIANFGLATHVRAGYRRHRRRRRLAVAGPDRQELSRRGPSRRQAIPDSVAGDRADHRSSRAGRDGLAGEPRQAREDHSRRGRHERRVLLLREGTRARRTAGRHQRQGDVPALRRHRLTGGGLARHAARMPVDVRALPQLSDSLAHVPGEGP